MGFHCSSLLHNDHWFTNRHSNVSFLASSFDATATLKRKGVFRNQGNQFNGRGGLYDAVSTTATTYVLSTTVVRSTATTDYWPSTGARATISTLTISTSILSTSATLLAGSTTEEAG